MSPKPILISIEGDIGAGKSTLIDALKHAHPDWHFIDEPVGTWQSLKNEAGQNLLELFYEDQIKYAYTFQNCAILSRAQNIQRAIQSWQHECTVYPELESQNIFVTERCLETDYYVFAKMMYESGKMGILEWDLYQMWYRFVKETSTPLSGIIYVSTPPRVCSQRIVTRGRSGEEHIPMSYLESLETYQKNWLYNSGDKTPLLDYVNYGPSDEHNTITDVEQFIATYCSSTTP